MSSNGNHRDRNIFVFQGDKQTRCFSRAHGPGLWLIETEQDKVFQFLDPDGKWIDFDPGIGLGRNAECKTIGAYLVVWSGWDAKGPAETDFLGNTLGEASDQPPTMAVWRWKDLLESPNQAPLMTFEGRLDESRNNRPGLLVINGQKVDHVDLTGEKPVIEDLIPEQPKPIHRARANRSYYELEFGNNERAIYDNQGRERWRGKANWVEIKSQRWAVLIDEIPEDPMPAHHDRKRAYRLVELKVDPAERNEAKMDLDTSHWGTEADCFDKFIKVSNGAGWALYDPGSKKPHTQHKHGPPEEPKNWGPRGRQFRWNYEGWRWGRHECYLVPKDETWLERTPDRRWRPKSVFPNRYNMLVLDHDGFVHGAARGKDFKTLLTIRAEDFGIPEKAKSGLFLLNRGREIVAIFSRGPKASTSGDMIGKRGKHLDSGRWKESRLINYWAEDRHTFMAPRQNRMKWSRDRAGFNIRGWRSTPDTDLFVFTESVIIELDPAATKRVAVPQHD